MKHFDSVKEHAEYTTITEYLQQKCEAVLNTIKPICDAFGIKDYDYVVDDRLSERLVLEGTKIGCTSDSIATIVNELVIYLFVNYAANRFYNFKKQSLNELTRYWIKD